MSDPLTTFLSYAPTPLQIGAASLGIALGGAYWVWKHSGPRTWLLRDVGDDRAADVVAVAHKVLAKKKVRAPLAPAELSELLLFYERWLNLDAEQRSVMREDLAREGIDMIHLGEALRALLDQLPD